MLTAPDLWSSCRSSFPSELKILNVSWGDGFACADSHLNTDSLGGVAEAITRGPVTITLLGGTENKRRSLFKEHFPNYTEKIFVEVVFNTPHRLNIYRITLKPLAEHQRILFVGRCLKNSTLQ